MSFDGYIRFFTETPCADSKRALGGLVAHLQPERILSASSYTSRSWEVFQASLNGIDLGTDGCEPIDGMLDPSLEQVEKMLDPELRVTISLSGCSIAEPISAEVRALPAEIIGDFWPGRVSLTIGPSDIFEAVDIDQIRYFGRSTVSIAIMGPGSPNDWNGARERIQNLPSVLAAKKALSTLLPDIQVAVHWDG